MKHSIIIFLFLLSRTVCLYAQPTLTSTSNNLVIDDTFTLNASLLSAGSGFNINTAAGPAGASVTWRFDTLSPTLSYNYITKTCSTTPFCSSFPGSDISLCEMTSGTNHYTYYKTSTSSISLIGDTTSSRMYYNRTPELLLSYPFTYLNTATDSCTQINRSTVKRIIHRYICDGYGTLKLPGATYTNVLRIKDSATHTDTSSTFGGVTVITYLWYTPGIHIHLLNYSYTSLFPVATYYSRYPTTSIPAINTKFYFTIHPNPSKSTISFNIPITGQSPYQIIDVNGKMVKQGIISSVNNEVDIRILDAGMYFIYLVTNNNVLYSKFIKE